MFERFYLGGPNTVRSFKPRRISPIDSFGQRIGGNGYDLANLEYIIPLPYEFRLAGFMDMGNVYGFGNDFDITDQRYAIGGGVRWRSPFGPIRIDYGINPDRRTVNGKKDDFGAVQFSVGSPF